MAGPNWTYERDQREKVAYSVIVPNDMPSMRLSLSFGGWRVRSVVRTCSSVKARAPQSRCGCGLIGQRFLLVSDLVCVFCGWGKRGINECEGGGGRTCVMDHHDIREADKVIQSEYIVQHGRRMTAQVAHDDRL